MANIDSDPPVSVPPVQDGELVITAGTGKKKHTLTIKTGGKPLKLIVVRDGVRFEAPIDTGRWSLDIV